MEVLGPLLALIIFLTLMVGLCGSGRRPRRGSYVCPPINSPRPIRPPVMFHSKYCAGRYGSPCNCEGPHA